MKQFNVEIFDEGAQIWDGDAIPDYVEAEDADEAISLAIDYCNDCMITNGYTPNAETLRYRAIEID